MWRISKQSRIMAWWPRRVLKIGLVWAAILILLSVTTDDPSPEDYTIAISITLSGVYTLLLRAARRWWLPHLVNRPLRNAIILGVVNAAVIEALFLVVEKLCGATGVAAHPNLLLDWLFTMPWYAGMVAIFARVQFRRRFDPAVVLLLGGVYEMGGDGIAGGLLSGEMFNPFYVPLLITVMWWLFIPVYSSMVLPPAWVIAAAPPPADPPGGVAWRDALRPLLWLIPFILYVGAILIALAMFDEIG